MMEDGMIMLTFDEDGKAEIYDDEFDITIHCTSQESYDEALKILRSANWIPCSERLPSEDDSFNVLCCDKYGEIMIGHVFACDDSETFYSAESEHEYMYNCVAWRPLPEPWKGEEE